jgi:HlyD family secretion protein
MLKRILPFLLTLGIVGAFLWTLWFLYKRAEAQPITYKTAAPATMDIVKKTVAPGAIVPREEVAIKPRVSGVISKLHVEPGQYLKEKALIAEIQIIPDVVSLNNAEASLKTAQIGFDNAKMEHERFTKLHGERLISDTEFNQHKLALELKRQELDAAENNLQLVKVGASKKSGKVSNVVYSTVSGMVLEVPVKVGGSVIEANNFNEGTTIAAVADMNDMIFQGRVDESEVGKIKEGMPVSIAIGALGEEARFDGKLEYISPKGKEKEGTIEFEVRAAVSLKQGVFLRANYSANADIILERHDRVLAISESLLQFDKGKPYVEVEVAPQRFERKDIQLGLSDGIHVEIKSGIDQKTKIKVPEGSGDEGLKSGGPKGPRRAGAL